MNTNKLTPLIYLGLCMPGAAWANVETNQIQAISVPDYAIPNDPICEMMYSQNATQFTLWAPSADKVEVRLYDDAQDTEPTQVFEMMPRLNGIWSAFLSGDWNGMF